MNKAIKSILIVITLAFSMLVGASSVNAESITISKVWNSNGVNFRNTTSGSPAYCMEYPKQGPKKGDKLNLYATYKKGPYVYILNNTKIAGSGLTTKSRTIRQKALWYYRGYSIKGSYTTEAKKLVSAAKNAGSNYEINPTVVSITTPKMTKSGSYYTSQKLTVKLSDVKNNKYTVSFVGAPSGTKVIEKNGLTFKVRVPVSSVKKTTSFKVKVTGANSSHKYAKVYTMGSGYQKLAVPVSVSKKPTKQVTTKVTYQKCHIIGSTYYGKNGTVVSKTTYYNECNPKCSIKNGKYYNNNGVPVTQTEYYKACNPKCEIRNGKYYNKVGKPVTQTEYNKECNPSCKVENGVYYGKNGNVLPEEEYNKECNPSCKIENGVYYGKNGNVLTEEEYNKECNPSCKIENGVYYGKNGNVLTEEEYNKECNPSCKVENGVYYGKNGNILTEEEYNKECNPSCKVENGVYYGKNGNVLTEEEYNKECNPSCKVENGVYYGKNGNVLTEEEYNKECNPSCKIENGVYYGKNHNVVTKEVYKSECLPKVVIKKIKVPNTGSTANLGGMILGLSMIIGSLGLLFKGKINRKNM